MIYKNAFAGIFLISILVICACVYSPGLAGGFLFDDYPNLQSMGDYGGVNDWESFKSFVLNGHSGPLGRPISLASFLLDDNTWPSKAEWFKTTNLKIHLLCAVFLCWMVLHLMRLMGRDEAQAGWIAVLCAAFWVLHPFLLSTTLYVVQRMAQLATLFVFVGLTAYLYGRLLLVKNQTLGAYLWMSGGLGLGTILAVFSKENGILLPLFAYIIESCIPSSTRKPNISWQIIFFGLPIIIIAYLFYSKINLSPNPWPNRNFNQLERLLSESRIFWEYVYYLFVPQIEGRGLFQDGYQISKGIFNPPVTLFAVTGIIILFIGGLMTRRKYPLIALAILFFMASHLIESTIIPLELYFEHRNYPGAGLIFLPIAAILVSADKLSISAKAIIVLTVITMFSFLTWKRASLWSDSLSLEKYWAISAPESARAQNKLTAIYLQYGQTEKAFNLAEQSLKKFPGSSLVSANYLLMKVSFSQADENEFRKISRLFVNQPFDAQSIMGLQNLVNAVINHNKREQYVLYMIDFLNFLQNNSAFSEKYQFKKLYTYSLGKLYLAIKDYDSALDSFSKAVIAHNDMDSAMSMIAMLANDGRPVEASMLLYQVEKQFNQSNTMLLKRSREVYKSELIRIKSLLDQDLKSIGISKLIFDKSKEYESDNINTRQK